MTWVLLRCHNCGAEPRLDASLVTLVVNLAEDRASVRYTCGLCGTAGETCQLIPEIQTMLLDAGASLAATP